TGSTRMTILFRFVKKHAYVSMLLLGCSLVSLPIVYARIITLEYLLEKRSLEELGRPKPWTLAESVTGMWWCVIRDQQFPYQRNSCIMAGAALMGLAVGMGVRDFWGSRTTNPPTPNPDPTSKSD